MIAGLGSAALQGIEASDTLPPEVQQAASTALANGAELVSDAQLAEALEASDLPADQQAAILTINADARIVGLQQSMVVVMLFAGVALLASRRLPMAIPGGPPGAAPPPGDRSAALT